MEARVTEEGVAKALAEFGSIKVEDLIEGQGNRTTFTLFIRTMEPKEAQKLYIWLSKVKNDKRNGP